MTKPTGPNRSSPYSRCIGRASRQQRRRGPRLRGTRGARTAAGSSSTVPRAAAHLAQQVPSVLRRPTAARQDRSPPSSGPGRDRRDGLRPAARATSSKADRPDGVRTPGSGARRCSAGWCTSGRENMHSESRGPQDRRRGRRPTRARPRCGPRSRCKTERRVGVAPRPRGRSAALPVKSTIAVRGCGDELLGDRRGRRCRRASVTRSGSNPAAARTGGRPAPPAPSAAPRRVRLDDHRVAGGQAGEHGRVAFQVGKLAQPTTTATPRGTSR